MIKPQLRLNRLELTNFKRIAKCDLTFKAPTKTPDITLLAGKSGTGKTAILEACALLFLLINYGNFLPEKQGHFRLNLPDMFIKSGEKNAKITGWFQFEDDSIPLSVTLEHGRKISFCENLVYIRSKKSFKPNNLEQLESALYSLTSYNSDPLLFPSFAYLHSYRKVQQGGVRIKNLITGTTPHLFTEISRYEEGYKSSFKQLALRLLMSKDGLLEKVTGVSDQEALNFLGELIKKYTSGKSGRIRIAAGDIMEYRIDSSQGVSSFDFDTLGTGQKELISNLFLCWSSTVNLAGTILIDQPELHLSDEQQREFIRQLIKLTPDNQYILASSSNKIAKMIPESHKISIPDFI